jgi:hypothetical protein
MIGQRRVDAVTKFSKPLLLSVAALGATLLTAGRPAAADEHMTLVDKIAVPPAPNVLQSTCSLGTGLGAFDISFVDPKSGFYVLSDRTNAAIDFFDASDDTYVGRVGGFQGIKCSSTTPATADNSISGPDGVVILGSKEVPDYALPSVTKRLVAAWEFCGIS